MWQWMKNVWFLSRKELRSLLGDYTLMVLIVVVLSVAVYTVSTGITTEVRHSSIAILDADHSQLSYQIRDALQQPYFKTPVLEQRENIDQQMNQGGYVFVIDIPANFEKDVVAGRAPEIQVLADATSVTQAGIGLVYLQQIISQQVSQFLKQPSSESLLPVKPVLHVMYNPNGESHWYLSVVQIIANITLLAMVLVGAAIIREREHGTIEHLLVMPVSASEIAMAKILTNGLVITVAALLSLWLVVNHWLQVPINGSVTLFTLGTVIYLFSVSALGIWLATLAPTMPQFGLLCLPVYVVTRLLSGSESPLESMPEVMQWLTQISPVTQYVQFGQFVLFRNASIDSVWDKLLIMTLMGIVFLALALGRFRHMLARQG
ncbi:ABC transporter permease [Acinetobacter baumannii]|uniref:ABC transporter permease n=2 Tax=Acinetobacter baumannii TaxID=470 RepID=UPI00281046D0|nr:ABC transporter permease [Acinetobacter baumannii]MDQ8951315.1 ABC transporter permease [Acinetobacter baumannii]MDQ8965442.1 ABC transporter permease [Acinetobacter baumannii]MDQ8983191.1 ABC transporter permease [Acinetobacter baumannii]